MPGFTVVIKITGHKYAEWPEIIMSAPCHNAGVLLPLYDFLLLLQAQFQANLS